MGGEPGGSRDGELFGSGLRLPNDRLSATAWCAATGVRRLQARGACAAGALTRELRRATRDDPACGPSRVPGLRLSLAGGLGRSRWGCRLGGVAEGLSSLLSLGRLLLGGLAQRGLFGLAADRVLELTHPRAERAADLGQPLGAEDQQQDDHQESDVEWVV